MSQIYHTSNVTPPRSFAQPSSVLLKAKNAYALWFKIMADFPKVYRYTLGGKIEDCFLELLETILISLYLPVDQKCNRLTTAIAKLDGLKFFLQLAWENKCLTDSRYAILSELLNEVGRMLGGWKKGLEKKTPPN